MAKADAQTNSTADLISALEAFMRHFAPLESVDAPNPEVLRCFETGRRAVRSAKATHISQ